MFWRGGRQESAGFVLRRRTQLGAYLICFSFPQNPCPDFFQAGVENFVFISAAGAQHEHALLRGYWKGKQKAEKAILEG